MLRNVLILILAVVFSNCNTIRYRSGVSYYNELAYTDAIKKFERVSDKNKYPDLIFKLGDCYRLTGNNNKSIATYGKIVTLKNCQAQHRLYYAESLMKAGRYKDAKNWFGSYLSNTSMNDPRAKELQAACDSIMLYHKDSELYIISEAPFNATNVNSYSAAFYKDGVVFVSDRPSAQSKNYRSPWTGQKYYDLYVTEPEDKGVWSIPVPFGDEINTPYNEGPCVFNKDFSIIYFTRNNYDKNKISKNNKDESILKIYKGILDNNTWKTTGELSFNATTYSSFHPAMASNGQTMYFASDMPWGYGGTDIYRVRFINGRWSKPENLGSQVNSLGNEAFPFIVGDSILYFSSTGHGGLGGFDIYSAELKEDKWAYTYNLGHPVNSAADDFAIIINKNNEGYFTSNRNSKVDKIYSIKKLPPQISIAGKVTGFPDGEIIPQAIIRIYNNAGIDTTFAADAKGEFKYKLDLEMNYKVYVGDKSYYSAEFDISTLGKKSSEVLDVPVALDHIILNKPKINGKIRFETKSTIYRKTTNPALDDLANMLKQNPQIKIQITSYTDSRSDDKSNLKLTNERGIALKESLMRRGINAARVVTKGEGENKIINHCKNGIICIDEEHEDNNRVEITVLSFE
ncbi:MAG: OmpA family protein [Bacteroidetes bacterium]|nr:OmpA family protein [Bacteroidota bacterium]